MKNANAILIIAVLTLFTNVKNDIDKRVSNHDFIWFIVHRMELRNTNVLHKSVLIENSNTHI